jgi:hypothetical protein
MDSIISELNKWKTRPVPNSIKIDDKYYTLPYEYHSGKYYNDRSCASERYDYNTDGTGVYHCENDSTFFNWKIKEEKDSLFIIRHCYKYITYSDTENINKIETDKFEFTKYVHEGSYYLHIKFNGQIFYRHISLLNSVKN